MNTTQLECFVQVAETLNFIRAAQNMNLSQPALSKQVMSLEAELGVRLLERTTRSVRLTEPGQRFLSDAQFILGQIDDARRRVVSYNAARLLSFRIGYSDEHELQRIGMVIRRFRSLHPDVSPALERRKRDDNLGLLREEKLDVVLALQSDLPDLTRGKGGGGGSEPILFEPLLEDRLYCVVPEGHPFRGADIVTAEEVRHQPQILCIPYNPVSTVRTSNFLRSVPLNAEERVTICSSSSEAYALTLSGLGISILPMHLIVPFPSLHVVPIADSRTQVYGVYHRRPDQEKGAAFLTDFLACAAVVFSQDSSMEDLWPAEYRNEKTDILSALSQDEPPAVLPAAPLS